MTKRIKKAYASVRKIAKALQNDAIFEHKERLKIQITRSLLEICYGTTFW